MALAFIVNAPPPLGLVHSSKTGVQQQADEARRLHAQSETGTETLRHGCTAALAFGTVASLCGRHAARRKTRLALRASKADAPQSSAGRRDCISGTVAALAPALALRSTPSDAIAEELVEVYFGCGCFWHVQHEFVQAEKRHLARSDSELTSLVGYAGGLGGARDNKVCYHNALGASDYGSLGHAEVVRMLVPPSKFLPMAEEYVKLFDRNGSRPDQFGDRGLEYRNLVGLPGGSSSPLMPQLEEASQRYGNKLEFQAGKGSDGDVRALVYVMDTKKYPFFVGEPYHQFHDGFNIGEDYPDTYNNLTQKYVKEGKVRDSGCPNGMFGLGIAGL
mmetsp:Transcript_64418/g.123980  ORF Transcript_64418/g.123980 Transcript_64418/m.123980 type:complete len:333 (-) Transcript_64418:75-1073(-)